MTYLCNAFSLSMLQGDATVRIKEVPSDVWEAYADSLDCSDVVSAVGHADTAAVLGVPMSRINVSLGVGDVCLVAQLQGGRLPEGSTTLPEGFAFKYFKVCVYADELFASEV
jgi:hypothetical protein